MTSVELPVTLYGTHLGELVRSGDRALLRWSDDAAERWGVNATVLSRGLRVGFSNTAQTESFFGGLLPEGVHLDRLAAHAQTASNDLVGLLAIVGADLAGALRVGSERESTDPEILGTEQLIALLDSADGFLVGGGGSALPGFQRKLTLTREAGRWVKGNGTVPSTHILKPVPAENRSAVEAEAYTLKLARHLGLLSYEVDVEQIGERAVLIVERFDRVRTSTGAIERLHQEDAAQALGLPWGGNDKFERNNPASSLRAIAELLDTRTTVFDSDGAPDRLRLLRYAVFTVAVGNSDAHAKNFSLLHDESGDDRLAPLYDAAPLALDFAGSQGLALRINERTMLPDVTVEDLVAEAVSWGVAEAAARETVATTLDALIDATRRTPAHDSIERHVPGYIRGQAQNLAAGRAARIPSAVPLMSRPRIGSEPDRG
jgi:serine/threonine-protein kinase HipA